MFITPGAPRVLIMSQSMNYGFTRSLWTATGDITANTLQMILVLIGLGALIKIFPNIVSIFKWAGIIYILYIAFGYLTSKTKISITTGKQTKSTKKLFMDGFFVAFFSPKATTFFVAVFPTFITGENYLVHFFVLWISYVSLDFLTLAIYSKIAEKIVDTLKSNADTINKISALALFIIALVIGFKV
ncbi:MAG: LysE family translocator [Burkholderiaceae bacterium]